MAENGSQQRLHKRLSGQHDHTLDDKGRISIPAEFRSVLGLAEGSELMVTRIPNFDCLLVFRPDAFDAWLDRLSDDPRDSAPAVRRVVSGSARTVKLDKLGRISLPHLLREQGKLQAKCYVVGQNDHLEVWDEGNWKQKYSDENFEGVDADTYL